MNTNSITLFNMQRLCFILVLIFIVENKKCVRDNPDAKNPCLRNQFDKIIVRLEAEKEQEDEDLRKGRKSLD